MVLFTVHSLIGLTNSCGKYKPKLYKRHDFTKRYSEMVDQKINNEREWTFVTSSFLLDTIRLHSKKYKKSWT